MKEEPHNSWIDPELETRIVNLVLGEASDEERQELEQLIRERPELATFKAQMAMLHGQLQEVAVGQQDTDNDEWKLSADRRSALLGAIDGETKEEPVETIVLEPTDHRKSVRSSFFWNLSKVAALIFVIGIIGILVAPASRKDRYLANEFKPGDVVQEG